jgi:hypothetical protein
MFREFTCDGGVLSPKLRPLLRVARTWRCHADSTKGHHPDPWGPQGVALQMCSFAGVGT